MTARLQLSNLSDSGAHKHSILIAIGPLEGQAGNRKWGECHLHLFLRLLLLILLILLLAPPPLSPPLPPPPPSSSSVLPLIFFFFLSFFLLLLLAFPLLLLVLLLLFNLPSLFRLHLLLFHHLHHLLLPFSCLPFLVGFEGYRLPQITFSLGSPIKYILLLSSRIVLYLHGGMKGVSNVPTTAG